ncbi:MAG: gliding motility protein GldM [Flavobacteriaceae bacterium]|nr:gliding motility protein GldM [Flavobacteriaceae bacterium]
MAVGKLSPRQKMINLMYLIFIAMLAMNMSKEVLSAFGYMNEKLEDGNITLNKKNDVAFKSLATKAIDQKAKYESLKIKAEKIKDLSDTFYNYLSNLKSELTKNLEDPKDFEKMDGTDILDQYFFTGGEINQKGQEFLDNLKLYRDEVNKVLGKDYAAINPTVYQRFQTEDVEDREGVSQSWLKYHFEGYPLIASLTRFTQIQSDIKETESDILSAMLQGQLERDVSLNNYDAIVVADKTAFFQGEHFKGKIYLGRKDDNLKAERVTINGKKIKEKNLQKGQVVLDFPSGRIGTRTIKGEFVFIENGEEIKIPIFSEYAVVPKPNGAVISADKMNVVYRGVPNPITISMPGISNNKITATADGLKRIGTSENYMMNPGKGRKIDIVVVGVRSDGIKVRSSRQFRIKDIPAPVGTIRGQLGNDVLKMPKSSLNNATIGATLPDFDFDLNLRVLSFSIKVPGKPTLNIKGKRLNEAGKRALSRARRGDNVMILNIKAKLLGNEGYYLKKISPVIIEITN